MLILKARNHTRLDVLAKKIVFQYFLLLVKTHKQYRGIAMTFYLKLAAYTFLALMGFSAWRAGVEGWRYYFAIVLFFFCVLRILTILRQRVNRPHTQSGENDTNPPPSADT